MRLKGDKKVNIYNHKVYFAEEWSGIKGHYDYQISTNGTIINTKTDTILKPFTDSSNSGYRVSLNGKSYYVCDLVAKAFLEGYRKGDKVRHIDGDKSNNKLRNLYIERVVRDESVDDTPAEIDNEVWKDSEEVIGKEGYEISDKGRIRNKKTNRFLKPYRSYSNTRENSNLRVDISDEKYYVHYLVAKAFLNDFKENLKIFHKDKDATNNNIDNLYQIKDNTTDAPAGGKGVIKEFIPININNKEEVKEENEMEQQQQQQNIFGEVENWKQIEGRNNMYEISDCGRIYSHYTENFIGYNTRTKGGIIVRAVQFSNRDGYDGYKKVDELVLEYFNNDEYKKFISNERAFIRHKNNDYLDNHINNLEVVIPFASDFNNNVIDINSKSDAPVDAPVKEPKSEPAGGVSFYIKEEVSFNGKDDTIIKLLELIRNTSIDSAGEIAISREEVDKINNFLS